MKLQFALPPEAGERIDDMVERARQRGVEHVTRSSVARTLLQVALGVPAKVAAAHEVAMQAHAMQINLSKRMRAAVLREIEQALNMDLEDRTE